jgi:hypothetical protein
MRALGVGLALIAIACAGEPLGEPAESPPRAARNRLEKPVATQAPDVHNGPPGPLPEPLAAQLRGIRADPPPRATTRNRHYFTSNENAHHLWRPAISDLGGILIGVGTDQNYLLAGWARPEVLVLLDYDQWVVDLNWVYGLLFEKCAGPHEFIEAWRFKNREQTRAWIEERWPKMPDRFRKLRAFEAARGEVHGRLEQLERRHRRLQISSFLDDPEQYAYLAALFKTGRAISVRGNLIESMTLNDVAAFARDAKLVVRVLYLSNAEDYFRYSERSYRDNVRALPFDERSVILHTKPRDGSHYRYLVQAAHNYRAWVASERVASFCQLFAYASPVDPAGQQDLYSLTALPGSKLPATSSARCEAEE